MNSWPTGQRLAVVVNVMYEQWSPGTAPGIGPMGNPLPKGATDYQALSWADYGHRTGIWRLLELLKAFETRASVYASGILTETAPDTIRAIVDGGHELCAHSWSQDIIPAMLDESAEKDMIARSVGALESVAGVRPKGWISPRCTPSAATARLLAEAGFEWFGDVADADLPYRIDTEAGPIVGVPFDLDVNDMPLHIRYGQPHRALVDAFRDTLEALRAETHPAYVDVTVHAHVGGRPAGRGALREVLTYLAGADDLWVTTRGELAATVA